MQSISPSAASYDRGTIWFHWLTVLLVVGQWVGGKTVDFWPRAMQVYVVSTHITFGLLLGLLVLARLYWRATGGRRLPAADRGVLQWLAKAVHWGLYLLILTVVGLGLAMLSQRSVSYFNLFMLPSLASGTRQALRAYHGNHELLATTILIVAGLHAAAALLHQYLWRDGVLARMIPGLR